MRGKRLAVVVWAALFCVCHVAFNGAAAYAGDPGAGEPGAAARKSLEIARTALAANNDATAIDAYMDVLREYPSHYEALFEAGKALFRRGDAAAGSVLFSRLVETAAHDPGALFDIGVAAWDLNRPVEAHAALSRAMADLDSLSARDAGTTKRILGKIYTDWSVMLSVLQDGDLEQDDRALSRQIEKHPDDAVLRALRGFVREKRDRLHDAIADFTAAQSIGLADMELRPLVQKARIVAERFEFVAKEDGHDPEREFAFHDIGEAVRLWERKRDWDGLDRYLDGLADYPSVRVPAAVQLGYLRISRGNLDGAEDSLNLALNSGADAGQRADVDRARLLIGELLARDGGTPYSGPESGLAAIASQPSLMKTIPVLPWAHISDKIRLAERLMGRQAFPALDIVLDQLSAMPMNDAEKGRYLVCLGESVWAAGREDEAVALFRIATELPLKSSRLAHAQYRFARHYAKKGNIPLAEQYARQSIELTDGYDWAHIRVGSLFVSMRQYEKGIAHFERAMEMAVTPEEKCAACKAIAGAYSDMGDEAAYLAWAQKYIDYTEEIAPPVPGRYAGTAEFYRGEIQFARGETDAAYASYERAAALSTDPAQLAKIHMTLAEAREKEGRLEEAADHARLSAAQLPRQRWKLHQVGSFLVRLGRLEEGADYIEQSLALQPSVPSALAGYRDLAERFRSRGDRERYLRYARGYAERASAAGDELSPDESGMAAFYQGEIHAAAGEHAEALAAYERASQLLISPVRLSDAFMKMAESAAALDDGDQAVRYAQRSAELAPERSGRAREAAAILKRFSPGAAIAGSAAPAPSGPRRDDTLRSRAALADSAKQDGDEEGYLENARLYLDALAERGDAARPDEIGLGEFFRAELHRAAGEADPAYAAYERSTETMTDKYRLAEAYMNMAVRNADLGRDDLAVAQAELSAEQLPDRIWKLREVGNFLMERGRPDRAERWLANAAGAAATAGERLAILDMLADAFRLRGNREKYHEYARLYIDALDADGYAPTGAERGAAAYYEGELRAAAGDEAGAYEAYARAADLLDNRRRRSDAYAKTAEHLFSMGEREQAADRMERSVALLPEQPSGLRRAGDFFARLAMPDKAAEYYGRALEQSSSAADRASILAALADLAKDAGDRDAFLSHANAYMGALSRREGDVADEDIGLGHYYQAEIHAADNRPEEAFAEYEQAASLTTKPLRLSDILYRMALIRADAGDAAQAAELMERSVAVLPAQPWKIRQAAGLYASLGMEEKAAEYFERSLTMAKTAREKAAAHLALAERRKSDPDQYRMHVEQYLAALDEAGGALSSDDEGRAHYYRGELRLAEGKPALAIAEYERAAELLGGDARRAEAYRKMAEISLERGDRENALAYAEKALAASPEQIRPLKDAGAFFGRLELFERELDAYRRALSLAVSPREKASVIQAIADFHRARKELDLYLLRAREYIDEVALIGDSAAGEEQGLAAFFSGEIHFAAGEKDEAYAAYSRAADLLADKYRRSEALFKMAGLSAERGDGELALFEGRESAALLPDRRWRAAGVASLFSSMGRHWEAAEVLTAAVDLNPIDNASLYKNLAEVHVKGIDASAGMAYNAYYIDLLREQMESAGPVVVDNPYVEWWDARRRQTGWSKRWGKFESRVFGSRDADGDYYLSTNNELYFNTRFPNGFRGKIYGEIGWTLKSKFTGYHLSRRDGLMHPWESNPEMRETLSALVGFRFTPFRRISALDFRTEYVFGIGREQESDFRFRLKFDRSEGLTPRMLGRLWRYAKEEIELTYSTRNNDLTSVGTLRRGLVYSPLRDRNLLLAPYWSLRYGYAGKDEDKGERWSFQTGPGIVLRKYFWEDAHHAARAYFELNLHYRIGLTHGRQNALGFTMTTAF